MYGREVLSPRLPRKVILDEVKKLRAASPHEFQTQLLTAFVILGTISLAMPGLQNAAFHSGLVDSSTARLNLIITPLPLRCSIAFASGQDGQTVGALTY
jgi:hypothetical protein